MNNPAPGFKKNPDRIICLEPSPRRVRLKFGEEWIADSTDMMLMFESVSPYTIFRSRTYGWTFFIPRITSPTKYKGEAAYWSIKASGRVSENAVWAYQTPYDEMLKINLQDYCAFFWDRVDHWFEEDEEVFVHPRDPYKRIDAVPSSRNVKVVAGGETIADTTNAHFLFETDLPTRYYIPATDVRTELLKDSATTTQCPYKGIARYHTATIGDSEFQDIAWYYQTRSRNAPRSKT